LETLECIKRYGFDPAAFTSSYNDFLEREAGKIANFKVMLFGAGISHSIAPLVCVLENEFLTISKYSQKEPFRQVLQSITCILV